ncbi:hypothetical protein ACFL4E_02325 [Candidatus Omnitrophota bacterium]
MLRKIILVLILFMLFSMPIWQFYLHLDRLGQVGDSSSPSTWSETYNVGFPATYMSFSHTRVVDKSEPRDKPNDEVYHSNIVSIERFYPLGLINFVLFILAIGGFILIGKKKVKILPVVRCGLWGAGLYVVGTFLFSVDAILMSIRLFSWNPNSLFPKTLCNVAYDWGVLGRCFIFPLPTVTRNYFDITNSLHMKIIFAIGLIFWSIVGMVLYKLYHFVKAKARR